MSCLGFTCARACGGSIIVRPAKTSRGEFPKGEETHARRISAKRSASMICLFFGSSESARPSTGSASR